MHAAHLSKWQSLTLMCEAPFAQRADVHARPLHKWSCACLRVGLPLTKNHPPPPDHQARKVGDRSSKLYIYKSNLIKNKLFKRSNQSTFQDLAIMIFKILKRHLLAWQNYGTLKCSIIANTSHHSKKEDKLSFSEEKKCERKKQNILCRL